MRPSTKRLMIIAALNVVAIGSAPVAGGPHGFDQPRRHQTTDPTTQNAEDTAVAANARCFQRELAAVARATAASIGKYAGNVVRH